MSFKERLTYLFAVDYIQKHWEDEAQELLIATEDTSSLPIDADLQTTLRIYRERLKFTVAYVLVVTSRVTGIATVIRALFLKEE